MSNGLTPSDGPRKRVVLKVWRQNGVLCDNAHEITWLERNGWRVECAEKLLDDPADGTCCVLYVLGPAPTPPPPAPAPPATVAGLPLKEDQFQQVLFPANATRVVFVCRTTRGRIVVQPVSPDGSEQVITASPAIGHFPASAAGMVPVSLFTDGVLMFQRMAVLCINDATPALDPATTSGTAAVLPDAPDAEMRVDAFYTLLSQDEPSPTQVDKLIDARVKGGRTMAFYFELSRQHT